MGWAITRRLQARSCPRSRPIRASISSRCSIRSRGRRSRMASCRSPAQRHGEEGPQHASRRKSALVRPRAGQAPTYAVQPWRLRPAPIRMSTSRRARSKPQLPMHEAMLKRKLEGKRAEIVYVGAMDHNVTVLERAFQLAKSGTCGTVAELKRRLSNEGYSI